jgi:iron complex outermembrane receptor protein
LRLTAGLRWTSDTRSVRYEVSLIDASARVLDDAYMTGGDFFGTPLELFQVIPPFKDQRTWNNFSGRVIVDYELARNAMVYASASRGYRGGEFNNGTTSPSAATFVDPETLDAYEIGLKSELFNRKVRFNASAFIYKFKDQQVYVLRQNEGEVLATTILSNAGKSTIKGVEASLEAEPVRSVYLQGGIGILDARFDKFDYSPTVSYAGNYLSSAPKLTLNGTARYSTEVNDKLGFFAQVDANYLSRHYLTVYNVDYLEAKAYALVGARVGLTFGAYSLTGWVKNLTDTHYVGHSYSTGSLGFVNRIFGEPRTMGVTLEAKF